MDDDKDKKKINPFIKDTLLGMYLETRDPRYMNAFFTSLLGWLVFLGIGIAILITKFSDANDMQQYFQRLLPLFVIAGLLFAVSNWQGYRYRGILPSLLVSVISGGIMLLV